jgi:HEAT repeat protein
MSTPDRRFADRSLAEWRELFQTSPDPDERYRALQAIVALSDPAASFPILLRAIQDADSALRAGAARRLAQWAALSEIPGTNQDWTAVLLRWRELLRDDDPDVRFESAAGILALEPRDSAALHVVIDLLRDPETQPAMLAAILKIVARGDVPADIPWPQLLHHDQAEVREAAARAAGGVAQNAAEFARSLAELLDDEEPFVREEAAVALGRLGISSDAVKASLQTACRDDDPVVADAARRTLDLLFRCDTD